MKEYKVFTASNDVAVGGFLNDNAAADWRIASITTAASYGTYLVVIEREKPE